MAKVGLRRFIVSCTNSMQRPFQDRRCCRTNDSSAVRLLLWDPMVRTQVSRLMLFCSESFSCHGASGLPCSNLSRDVAPTSDRQSPLHRELN